MNPLSHGSRLQGLSTPGIVAAWERLIVDLAEEGYDFNDRKLKPGPAVNAVILHFLEKTDAAEKRRVMGWGLARLEEILREQKPEEKDGGGRMVGAVTVSAVNGRSEKHG